MLLHTPTRSDANSSGAAGYLTASGRHSGTTLTDALVRGYLPTPSARDWRDGKASQATHDRNSRPLNETVVGAHGNRGRLSPEFVEWMMGFPIGFTEI